MPQLPWPAAGQAGLSVAGIGDLGTSGAVGTPVPIASVAKVMTTYLILRDHPLKGGDGAKIKVDQTKSVKVEKINYCTSQAHRKIEGTVAVECESDDSEEVHINLAESFDVAVEIDNKTCAVTGFKIEPKGDIGKLIAKNTDFESKVRKAVEHEIAKACPGPS